MLRDIIDEFYPFIISLSALLVFAAIVFLGWYILLMLLVLGVCGGTVYTCYRIVEILKEAHKMNK